MSDLPKPDLIAKLKEHYKSFNQDIGYGVILPHVCEKFNLKPTGLVTEKVLKKGHPTTSLKEQIAIGRKAVFTDVASDPNQDALNLYQLVIAERKKTVRFAVQQLLSNSSLHRAALQRERQTKAQIFQGISQVNFHNLFDRIDRYGLMDLFKEGLDAKDDEASIVPRSVKIKLEKWERTQQHQVAQSLEVGSAIGVVDPALIKSLIEITDKLSSGEYQTNDASYSALDIAAEYDLDRPDFMADRQGKLPSGKAHAEITEAESLVLSNKARDKTLSNDNVSVNQDAYDLFTTLMLRDRKDFAIAGLSVNVDHDHIDTNTAHNKRSLRRYYNKQPIPKLQGMFQRLDQYGLLDLFEAGFGKHAQYETLLPKELGQKLEKWKKLQTKRAERQTAHETDGGLAVPENPEVNSSLIRALYDHYEADIPYNITPHTVSRRKIATDFDLKPSIKEMRLTASEKSEGKSSFAFNQKGHDNTLKSIKSLFRNPSNNLDQDAYNIYTDLIDSSREAVCRKTYQAMGFDTDETNRNFAYTKKEYKKILKDVQVLQWHSFFSRLEQTGLLDMFEHTLEADGEHLTILPVSMIKPKLDKWKQSQEPKIDQDSKQSSLKKDETTSPSSEVSLELTAALLNTTKKLSSGEYSPRQVTLAVLDIANAFGLERSEGLVDASGRLSNGKKPEESNNSEIDKQVVLMNQATTVFNTNDQNQDAMNLFTSLILRHRKNYIQEEVYPQSDQASIDKYLLSGKRTSKHFYNDQPITTIHRMFARLENYGLLDEFERGFGKDAEYETLLPKELGKKLEKWKELQARKADQQVTAAEAQNSQEPETKPDVAEGEDVSKAEKMPEADSVKPTQESKTYRKFQKDLSTQFGGGSMGGDTLYDDTKLRLIAAHKEHYGDLENDKQTPYEAADNDQRDIPRTYVPDLLPEGKSDTDLRELTGDFEPSARGGRGKREVVIQRERRDLIVDALKNNLQIDQSTIREFTHPEFDTEEGRYYTVIHAETHDGNWTQAAVSIAAGQPVFYDKHRKIVDPETGKSRLGISDLREDLFAQRVKFSEDHLDKYQNRANEIFTMSVDDVEPSVKTRIVWTAYSDRDEQVFNSLSEYIKKNGVGVDKASGIIMTGDMRDDPEDEHPSLVFRTRWDRVFWALDEEKIKGMEDIKTDKQLLAWAVGKDDSLFDCLNQDVQEWLCSDDEVLKPSHENSVNGHDNGNSSATVTAANQVLSRKQPANDDDDQTIEIAGGAYTRAQLRQMLG